MSKDKMEVVVPQERLGEEEGEANNILKAIASIVIETQDDLEFAAESLAEIKGKINALETERKSVTQPLNAVVKRVNGWFNKPVQVLKACETHLKKKIAAAHEDVFDRQRAALAEAAEASMEQDEARADRAMARAKEIEFEPVKGLALRHGFDYNIVDFEQIPREYLLVDDVKVKAVIKAHDGKISIPGIEIQRTTGVTSSAT